MFLNFYSENPQYKMLRYPNTYFPLSNQPRYSSDTPPGSLLAITYRSILLQGLGRLGTLNNLRAPKLAHPVRKSKYRATMLYHPNQQIRNFLEILLLSPPARDRPLSQEAPINQAGPGVGRTASALAFSGASSRYMLTKCLVSLRLFRSSMRLRTR